MQGSKIQWGIISTANINQVLIPAIRAEKRADLLAIASRSEERAKTYAREWKIPRWYKNYDELIEDKDIDVIYISLPNNLHAEWSIKAAVAGKHVLCEKPLTLSVEECQQMIHVARNQGVVLVEGFMYRFHPQTQKLHEIIMQGEIGEIQYIYSIMSYTIGEGFNIRTIPSYGGGSLWDLGSYNVNFSRFIAGEEPVEVRGWDIEYNSSGVDGSFFGMMRFATGAVAQFECSFMQPQRGYAEVVGTQGSIEIPYPWRLPWIKGKAELVVIKDNKKQVIQVADIDPYFCEVSNMCDCIFGKAKPMVSLEDSLHNIKTIIALRQSSEENMNVS